MKVAGIVGIIRDPRGAGQRDRIGVQIVRKRSDAPAARLDLVVQACLECRRIEYLVAQGSISIFEPAISPHAISTGAFHQNPERCPRDLCPESNLLTYSSRGPTKDGRIKPDLIAPSHVSTSSFGRYTGDGPGQNPGFDGTSASTPHLAGAAALIKQLFPNFTPKEVQSFLEGRAEDRGRRGKDNDWGAGQLVLGEVVIVPLAPAELTARGLSPTQIQLTWQDRSDNEEGFSIERRFAQDVEYEEIARVPANVTSFIDELSLPETPYCYRVRAFTRSGQSTYTNESCATTLAESLAPTVQEFSAQMQKDTFGWVELPSQIRQALPAGVAFRELAQTSVGGRTSSSLQELGLQLSSSTGLIFGSPIQTGSFPILMSASLDDRVQMLIWVLLTISPPATLSRSAQEGAPPQIKFIDFPAQIRADGKPVIGFVGFADPDGDLVRADFVVISATDFQSFQLELALRGRREGAFPFEIKTSLPQRVTLRVQLTDEGGRTSAPREFSFDAVALPVLRVSPERLSQSGLAGVGELPPLTLEVRNDGGSALSWNARTDLPWLRLAPIEGRVGPNERQAVTVQANHTALKPGRYRGLIMIRAPGAQNSPQWVPFVLELKPAGGTLIWKAQIGATTASPALASDGTLYIPTGKALQALRPDGQVSWTFQASQAIAASAVTLAPDGTIYVGADDGFLYALSSEGKERWRFATGGIPVRGGPALAADGTLYVGTGSDPFETTRFYALTPDGAVKFSPIEIPGGVIGGPAIAPDGTIYVGSLEGQVWALSPTNLSRKWRFRVGDEIQGALALGPDGTVYLGALNGFLYAIAPDGRERWRFKANKEIVSSAVVAPDGTVYIGSLDGHLYAIGADGKERWRFQTGGPIYGSPALAADGTIYIGSTDGIFYAVTRDGQQRWQVKTGGEIRSSPLIAPDGTIYFASQDGFLYAVRGEAGPAVSAWPMLRQNPQRTGRAP
ncbi:MAG: PQQ-binding-like beta-propeller repeat protein [Candidatus Bipolaricaulota bacterium]|nr:PQQ-binding-like beta-propeller repeat protein [Candidatus Bipolaricaulota bacterium]MCS7274083.1 PQQ-binding-like beta-propeller repeat protein [Candidatus Bipolaricaulota bacterium]MDW8110680.1 PQQ-binding-like beta-propeller repeat protein [Candidatus Bipolaricaulota bacterium]MDW8328462.1 PQQ-binding-like beta-propeller repeat protein [Candidatus Bipolaricaulota bacterium]